MDRRQTENENSQALIIAIIATCMCLSVFVVSLRFYVRLVLIRKFGPDDWALAAALVATVCGGAIMGVSVRLGLGRHADLLSLTEMSTFLKIIWFASMEYSFAITLMKATFLLQYRRVFPLPNFQRLCNIALGFLVIWAIAGLLGAMLNCLPLERNWDASAPNSCSGRVRFWEAYAIMHVITEVLILIMPLPLLKTLPLPKVQKGILMAVFCLGFFTCVISVIRTTTLRAALTDADATWTMFPTCLWTMTEALCAMICVCVPTLRPLVDRLCRRWKRRSLQANDINRRNEPGRSWKRPHIYGIGLETGTLIQSQGTSGHDNESAEVVYNMELSSLDPCHLQNTDNIPTS